MAKADRKASLERDRRSGKTAFSNEEQDRNMMKKFFSGWLLLNLLLLGGCIGADVSAGRSGVSASVSLDAPRVVAEEPGAYVLKPLDPIYVRFSGILEQQQPIELVIDENGEITLLHIDKPIKAAGLTPSQLARKIEKLYVDGGIYKHVSLSVTMTSKVYYVQGEVNAPGQFQLTSGTTLLQAIAGARGYTPYANKKKVTIARHGKIYSFSTKELEKDPGKDVKIKAGDVIKVWQKKW